MCLRPVVVFEGARVMHCAETYVPRTCNFLSASSRYSAILSEVCEILCYPNMLSPSTSFVFMHEVISLVSYLGANCSVALERFELFWGTNKRLMQSRIQGQTPVTDNFQAVPVRLYQVRVVLH